MSTNLMYPTKVYPEIHFSKTSNHKKASQLIGFANQVTCFNMKHIFRYFWIDYSDV